MSEHDEIMVPVRAVTVTIEGEVDTSIVPVDPALEKLVRATRRNGDGDVDARSENVRPTGEVAEATSFTTYENYNNPHVTIHREDCSYIRMHGGEHACGQGKYENHTTYEEAEAYARQTGLPLIVCSRCKPDQTPWCRSDE